MDKLAEVRRLSRLYNSLLKESNDNYEDADLDAPNPDLTDDDFKEEPQYNAKYFNNTRRYVPNGKNKTLDDELEAEVDAGAFAGEDPNIDTDDRYYSKATHNDIDPVSYDKRKIGHINKYTDALVGKPEDQAYKIYDDPDKLTDNPDPEYKAYLKNGKDNDYAAPGLDDIDPDDPNIKWFD